MWLHKRQHRLVTRIGSYVITSIYFYQQPADDSYTPAPQIPLFRRPLQLHKLQSAVHNDENNGWLRQTKLNQEPQIVLAYNGKING